MPAVIDPTDRVRTSFLRAVAEFRADRDFPVPWYVTDVPQPALTGEPGFAAYVWRLRRLTALFGVEDHLQVEATWGIYQRMIIAYREPDRAKGRTLTSGEPYRCSRRPGFSPSSSPSDGSSTSAQRFPGPLRPPRHQQRTHRSGQRAPGGHLRGAALGSRNLTNPQWPPKRTDL